MRASSTDLLRGSRAGSGIEPAPASAAFDRPNCVIFSFHFLGEIEGTEKISQLASLRP